MQAPPASQSPIHRSKRQRELERMQYTWTKSSYGAGQETSVYIVICVPGQSQIYFNSRMARKICYSVDYRDCYKGNDGRQPFRKHAAASEAGSWGPFMRVARWAT